MNAEQWNAMYPVGTLVFAYPGFRPEDDRTARRLVTRTRTKAQMSASGDPVVWVDGEGSYICLTHIDPVSESVWQTAKQAEETAAAVAAVGALPVPVGDQPQPLDLVRIRATGEIASKEAAEMAAAGESLPHGIAATVEDIPALLSAVAFHRHWEQVGWQKARAYNELWGRADDRLAEERHLVARLRKELSRQGRAHEAEIERLKAELAEAHQKKAAALASARQLMNRNRTEEAS